MKPIQVKDFIGFSHSFIDIAHQSIQSWRMENSTTLIPFRKQALRNEYAINGLRTIDKFYAKNDPDYKTYISNDFEKIKTVSEAIFVINLYDIKTDTDSIIVNPHRYEIDMDDMIVFDTTFIYESLKRDNPVADKARTHFHPDLYNPYEIQVCPFNQKNHDMMLKMRDTLAVEEIFALEAVNNLLKRNQKARQSPRKEDFTTNGTDIRFVKFMPGKEPGSMDFDWLY